MSSEDQLIVSGQIVASQRTGRHVKVYPVPDKASAAHFTASCPPVSTIRLRAFLTVALSGETALDTESEPSVSVV